MRTLLESGKGLLYVDNLETVDDALIITFLDSLPVGTRAIVTSRRTTVRVSVRPINLGSLEVDEALKFVDTLAVKPGFGYISDLSSTEKLQIVEHCDRIPLVIRWTLLRSKSAQEALASAKSFDKGLHGDELLEFCFRRIFDEMSQSEKNVLYVLSIFQRPMSADVILVGGGFSKEKLLDAVEKLIEVALVQRLFDPERNDYSYSLVPMASMFVYKEVRKKQKFEEKIRQTLTNWFEATDIKDLDERLSVSQIRKGKDASESVLVDLALAAERRNDNRGAQDLYEKALNANPRSWRAARTYAKFTNKKLNNRRDALKLYEEAANNAPRRGMERALIFKEWAILLKDCGDPGATDLAIEKLELSMAETPNDIQVVYPLVELLDGKGAYKKVILILEPLRNHKSKDVKQKIFPMLLRAYERTNDILKAAELRKDIAALNCL